LTTALDFSINAKVFGAGNVRLRRASRERDPYRMELEIEKADGSKEASVLPGIILSDVRGGQAGESIGAELRSVEALRPRLRSSATQGPGMVQSMHSGARSRSAR
jgi:hypothetical protein